MSEEKQRRAVISVFDKTGIVSFVKTLGEAKVKIIATEGTADVLQKAGIDVEDMSSQIGSGVMMNGRLKTLHARLHGGLLFVQGDERHEADADAHGIFPIDLLVVNLYPFEKVISKPNSTFHEAIENIDIGGPAMLRSASKNHERVTVISDPNDYEEVAKQIREKGNTTLDLRRRLAIKAFDRTTEYDKAIADFFRNESLGMDRRSILSDKQPMDGGRIDPNYKSDMNEYKKALQKWRMKKSQM